MEGSEGRARWGHASKGILVCLVSFIFLQAESIYVLLMLLEINFKKEAKVYMTGHVVGVRGYKARQNQLTRGRRPGDTWMCGETAEVASPVLRREGGEGSKRGSGSGGIPGSWEVPGKRGPHLTLPASPTLGTDTSPQS